MRFKHETKYKDSQDLPSIVPVNHDKPAQRRDIPVIGSAGRGKQFQKVKSEQIYVKETKPTTTSWSQEIQKEPPRAKRIDPKGFDDKDLPSYSSAPEEVEQQVSKTDLNNELSIVQLKVQSNFLFFLSIRLSCLLFPAT